MTRWSTSGPLRKCSSRFTEVWLRSWPVEEEICPGLIWLYNLHISHRRIGETEEFLTTIALWSIFLTVLLLTLWWGFRCRGYYMLSAPAEIAPYNARGKIKVSQPTVFLWVVTVIFWFFDSLGMLTGMRESTTVNWKASRCLYEFRGGASAS